MSGIFRSVLIGSVAGLIVMALANVCTTVYLHRALSHRALTLKKPAAMVFRSVIWVSTGIKPKEWVAVHRKHHAFTDVEGDPHSPVLHGWKTVQMKNVAMYRKSVQNPETIAKYARDLPDDRWDRYFFGHNKTGLGLGIAFLIVVLGPVAGVVAALVHLNVYLAGSAAVNAMGHHFGRRPHPNQATNLQWLAFITMGEGLHNNHHAAPSSPRLSHRWYQIDPGWWVIRTLTTLRLAKVRFSDIRLIPTTKTAL